VTEIYGIQIFLENGIFRKYFFEAYCQHKFFHFSLEGAILRQEEIARELLRNCASALTDLLVHDINPERANYPRNFNPAVLIKRRVLSRQCRLDHPGRNIAKLKRIAVFHEQLGYDFLVSIVHD